MDIVVAPDPANLKRIAEVAVEANGHVQKGEAFLSMPFSIAAELASGERVAIETGALRQMKQAADRPRDRVDIEDLDSTCQ